MATALWPNSGQWDVSRHDMSYSCPVPAPPQKKNNPLQLLLFLFNSFLTGSHIQVDLGSYVLWMIESLPTWILGQSLHKQKRNFYCLCLLVMFIGYVYCLCLIKANIILTKNSPKPEIGCLSRHFTYVSLTMFSPCNEFFAGV